MEIILSKNAIEHKVRHEAYQRKDLRKQIDQVFSSVAKRHGPERGDFKMCRECDKLYKSYREFKNPSDRKKIEAELSFAQREYKTREHLKYGG